MTHKEEIRIRFSKLVMELEDLFALYGSEPQLFLDAKFLQEKAKSSAVIQIIVELAK